MQTKILVITIAPQITCALYSCFQVLSDYYGRKSLGLIFLCRHVSMTTRQSGYFKMAVARTRAVVSESFDSFVAPVINKPVPNHLLETSKCIIK